VYGSDVEMYLSDGIDWPFAAEAADTKPRAMQRLQNRQALM